MICFQGIAMKATCEATAREIAFCLCVTLLARRVTVYVQCGTLLDRAVKQSCTGSIILGFQSDSKIRNLYGGDCGAVKAMLKNS